MIISTVKNAKTLNEVIQLINSSHSPAKVAAHAAVNSLEEVNQPTVEDGLLLMLECFESMGAEFNVPAALEKSFAILDALKIQRIRKQLRLTQEQLGDKLGITGRHISNLETGVRIPQIQTMLALEYLLNAKHKKTE